MSVEENTGKRLGKREASKIESWRGREVVMKNQRPETKWGICWIKKLGWKFRVGGNSVEADNRD